MHLGPFYASTSTRRRRRRKGELSGGQVIGYMIVGVIWLAAAVILLPPAGVLACFPRTRPTARRTLGLLRWNTKKTQPPTVKIQPTVFHGTLPDGSQCAHNHSRPDLAVACADREMKRRTAGLQ